MAYSLTGDFDLTKGVLGLPAIPRLTGDRPEGNAASSNNGSSAITLVSGGRYGRFDARNVGNGLFRVKGVVADVVIEHVLAENVYRVLECDVGATLNNFVFRNIVLNGAERSLARLRGDSGPGLIADCQADLGGAIYEGDEFHMVIHLDERCHDIDIVDVVGKNAFNTWVAGKYTNADIFVTEGNTNNIRFIRTKAISCPDGGYDIKGQRIELIDVEAEDCGKSLRVWCRDGQATTFTSRRPRVCHIGTYGAGPPKMVIEKFIFESVNPNTPLIVADSAGPGLIQIKSWESIGPIPAGQIVVRYAARGTAITWGPQGPPPGRTV
jgi:hypothetical protein